MRFEIKTNGFMIKDNDIKAIYLLSEAMKISSKRMIQANLQFIADKMGYRIIPKGVKEISQ